MTVDGAFSHFEHGPEQSISLREKPVQGPGHGHMYIIRLVQMHESFRKPELLALAELQGIDMKIVEYHKDVGEFYYFHASFTY